MTREEREDAIDIIQSILNNYEEDECLVTEITIGNKDIKAFKMAIESLEQEPKIGHWIMTGDYYTGAYGSIDYVECSCCHEYSLEEGDYCPNCGAKMVEPQESEG